MCMSIYFMSYVYVHIFYIVRLFHGSRGGDLRACTYILYCWAFFMARVAVGCMCIYAYIIYMYMSMYRAVYVTAQPSTNSVGMGRAYRWSLCFHGRSKVAICMYNVCTAA